MLFFSKIAQLLAESSLRTCIPVNMGLHLLSENENPRSVTGVWSSSPVLLSEYTFPHTGVPRA